MYYGHPEYVAPEIAHGKGVGYAADMWSVGIITYILLGGRSPFLGENDRETLTNIKVSVKDLANFFECLECNALVFLQNSQGWQCERFGYISDEGNDFFRRLLQYEAVDRLTVRGALDHPWFEKMFKTETTLDVNSKITDYLSRYK